MPEKIAIAVAGIMSIVLGIWAKVSFAKRSEVFDRAGRPLFQYSLDCAKVQSQCHEAYCGKIDELKIGQSEVRKELKIISDAVIRMEERISK